MADIRTKEFWIRLLQKLLKQFMKDQGISTGSKKSKDQHVVPHEDGWAVRGAGNERITASYEYQDDAIDRARDIAKNYGSSVIIHRKDGSIRDRVSYKK